MKLLCVVICVLAFTLSKAEVMIDNSYQCHDLYEYDASVKGEVTSPFYNERSKYHDGLWCEYRIRAPEGNRIKLTFKDIDIDPSGGCGQDFLVVYSKDKQYVLGKFCGTDLPHPLMSLEGENEVNLLFLTDFMVAGKGFRLQYESGPNMELCESGLKECKNRNCYNSKKKCDGVDDCGDGTDEEECGFPVVETKKCGVPVITPNTIFGGVDRMVGGETAIPNSWPWQVSLQSAYSEPNGHFCGGTLINSQWIITATHCVQGITYPEDLKIQIGSHYKYKKTQYEQSRTAVKIIAYPDLELEDIKRHYNMEDDISLVKLNAPIKFNDGVQPACLPHLGWELEAGWSCYATGWGESRGTGGSEELKQMQQIIESSKNCSYNKHTQICVSKPYNSPCHGDSGGPLQCRLGGQWYVFGAASYVTTNNLMSGLCVGPNAKTVYANVADKSDWIRVIINKYS